MSYEKTLEFKCQVVKDNLKRIGGMQDIAVNGTNGIDNLRNYKE